MPAGKYAGWSASDFCAHIIARGINHKIFLEAQENSPLCFPQLEHTWEEAYVPYENYRGIGPGTGEAVWVPLDPSFKLNNKIEGLNLEEISGLDRQSIIDASQGTGEMSPDGLTVTRINFDSLNSQLDETSARLETYINENGLNQSSIKEIIGGLFGLGLFVSAEYYLIDVLVQVCRYYTGDPSAGVLTTTLQQMACRMSRCKRLLAVRAS